MLSLYYLIPRKLRENSRKLQNPCTGLQIKKELKPFTSYQPCNFRKKTSKRLSKQSFVSKDKPFLKCFLWSLKSCFETRILLKFPHVCDNVTLLLLRRFYCIQRARDVSLLGAGLATAENSNVWPRAERRDQRTEWGVRSGGSDTNKRP